VKKWRDYKLANYASQVAGYLAAIKDLHTCEIAGWAMGNRMTKHWCWMHCVRRIGGRNPNLG